MKIVLNAGETITIEFAESDGDISVSFGQEAIKVITDWPDTQGRKGIIYEEKFVLSSDTRKQLIKGEI